MRKANIK